MARAWLTSKEEVRLSLDKLDRPSTKWSFVGWSHVWLKVIMTNQPLLGRGRLPDWLRQKKGLYALDARRQKRSETQGLATVRDYRYFCAQQTQY